MGKDVTTKMGMDVKDWKTGVGVIKRDNKVLNSEFKKIVTSVDDWKKSADALSARQEILNKKISNHTKIVSTMQKEYDSIVDQYGEASKEAQNYKIKLNYEEAALNGVQKELRQTDNYMEDLGEETEKSAKKTSAFQKILGAGISIAPFVAAGKAIIDVGKALFTASKETAAAGDRIDKLSQVLNLSRTGFQEWQFVMDQSGITIDSMQTGMKTLSQRMGDVLAGVGPGVDLFARLGVEISEGMSQEDAFNATITALQGMEDGIEKADMAQQLFGKNGQDLMPLLNTTAESVEELKEKANELGLVLSDDAVDASVKYTDAMGALKDTFAAFKNETVATMLPGLTQITDGLTGLINGTEGAAEGIESGAKSIVDSIVEIVPQMITIISTLAKSILGVAPSIIEALAEGILDALPMLLETVTDIIPVLLETLIAAVPMVISTVETLLPEIVFAIMDLIPMLIEAILNAIPSIITTLVTLSEAMKTKLGEMIPDIVVAVMKALPAIIKALTDAIPLLIQAGVDLFIALIEDMPTIIAAIIEAIPLIIEALVSGFEGTSDALAEIGENLVAGIWQGIKDSWQWLKDKVTEFSSNVVEGFKDAFSIKSPSKKTAYLGEMISEGLGEGIDSGLAYVIEKANKLKASALGALSIKADELQVQESGNIITNNNRQEITNNNNFTYGPVTEDNNEANFNDFEYRWKRAMAK